MAASSISRNRNLLSHINILNNSIFSYSYNLTIDFNGNITISITRKTYSYNCSFTSHIFIFIKCYCYWNIKFNATIADYTRLIKSIIFIITRIINRNIGIVIHLIHSYRCCTINNRYSVVFITHSNSHITSSIFRNINSNSTGTVFIFNNINTSLIITHRINHILGYNK